MWVVVKFPLPYKATIIGVYGNDFEQRAQLVMPANSAAVYCSGDDLNL